MGPVASLCTLICSALDSCVGGGGGGTVSFSDVEGAPPGVVIARSSGGVVAISTKGAKILCTVSGAGISSWPISDYTSAIPTRGAGIDCTNGGVAFMFHRKL